MQRFVELHTIDINTLPSEIHDSSRLLNLDHVSDFQAFDTVIYPIWEKNDEGVNIEYTTSQINAQSKIVLSNESRLYSDADSSTLNYNLGAYDIWVDGSANVCASCGHINNSYNINDSSFECPECGYKNEPWHYGEQDASFDASTCKWVYKTPFVEAEFINVDFLPSHIYKEGKISINRNTILEYEWYKEDGAEGPIWRNPLVKFVNNAGEVQFIRPQQIGAGTKILLKGGRQIFLPYSKSEFELVFDLNAEYNYSIGGSGGGAKYLADLIDVTIADASNNQVLLYNNDASYNGWKNSYLYIGGTRVKKDEFDASLFRIKRVSAFDSSYEGVVINPETMQKVDLSKMEFDNDASSWHGYGSAYFDGFLCAAGKNINAGFSGIDLPRLWQSLQNASSPVSPSTTTKIDVEHIPDISPSKVTNLESWLLDNEFIKIPHVWKSLTNSSSLVTPTSTTKIAVEHIPDISTGMITDLETWITNKHYALDASLSDYVKRDGTYNMTGDLHIGSSAGASPYIYWGDGSYVYIGEDSDDHMKIHADKGIEILDNTVIDKNLTVTGTFSADLGFDISEYIKTSDLIGSDGKIKAEYLPS